MKAVMHHGVAMLVLALAILAWNELVAPWVGGVVRRWLDRIYARHVIRRRAEVEYWRQKSGGVGVDPTAQKYNNGNYGSRDNAPNARKYHE